MTGDTLYIRGVDAATSTRFKVLAAHYGMTYPELLGMLTADAFDKAAEEGLFHKYDGRQGAE